MEKDIALGSEAGLKLSVVAGKLRIEITSDHASGKAGAFVEESADYFLDKLAALIPGVWDDAVIALAKQAIKVL